MDEYDREEIDVDEFYKKMVSIYEKHGHDWEYAHLEADESMEEELTRLGYGKAIEFLNKQTRWYA